MVKGLHENSNSNSDVKTLVNTGKTNSMTLALQKLLATQRY